MKKPILVMLAAGVGSRYGGLKQMDKFGTAGEVLLDYSVFDALRGGFGKVVFIIRRDIERDFADIVLRRIEGKVDYALAFQETDSLIPPAAAEEARRTGRTKPWGTAHALLCAADKLDAPFAVMNSDDFYGREAFAAIGAYLSGEPADAAIVPFRLEPTLSPQGSVARGVCGIKDGFLTSVEELLKIEKKDGVIFDTGPDGARRVLPGDAWVSMNFWGFPVSILPALQKYFDEFITAWRGEPKSECYLPRAADWFIRNGYCRFRVLEADSEWFGVTYKEDRDMAVKRLAALTASGVYPSPLWG